MRRVALTGYGRAYDSRMSCTNMVCDGAVRCYPDESLAAAVNMGCRVETDDEGYERAVREGQEANNHRDDDSRAIGMSVAGVAIVVVIALVARYARRR